MADRILASPHKASGSFVLAVPGILLVLICLTPFLNKAYTIDDPCFLLEARQILRDPLQPMSFPICWSAAEICVKNTGSSGIGSAQAPFSGNLINYMSQIASQQSQAANAATNLQQGQDAVVSALQQRFNSQSGVNIDTEMSNLINLQNAYGANARVMSTIQQMMSALLQMV